MKDLLIKITQASPKSGPYNIFTDSGDVIAMNVMRKDLIKGKSYSIPSDVNNIKIESVGDCKFIINYKLGSFTKSEYANIKYSQTFTGCMWRHLEKVTKYNFFYGKIEPYIIEYPQSYDSYDEIVQNVKDFTKAYQYLPMVDGVFNYDTKIEVDNSWFNKAILYNGQQSTGLLELVSKPKNNLQAYGKYPIYNSNSKTILYTKNDNMYQYNSFWAINKSPYIPNFNASCESMSIDKVINESNMDYSLRSFKKATIRGKELRIRHILDNTNQTHLVSQFLLTPSQISYK